MSQENAISKQPLIRNVNRQQMSWRAVDVEQLISEDHPARAIWTLVGRLDLRRFYENIESSAQEGGRPAIDPQLLIACGCTPTAVESVRPERSSGGVNTIQRFNG
jgi:hypothetical protein